MSAGPTREQTALHHIQELRVRLMYCAGVMVVGGAIGYIERARIIAFLQHPLNRQLFYTSPTGSFEFVMQVCFLAGFLVALPVICYHLLKYIEPAMPHVISRRLLSLVIFFSLALTVAGASFAYYISLPAALKFFNAVGTSSLHPLITIDQYFSFVIGYLATFAVIFQLPLILLFINRIKPMGPTSLSHWRKHVFVAAFAIALILPSAPDPLSQVILALPMIALYELSIWLVRVANWKRKHKPQTVMAPVVVQTLPSSPVPPRPPVRAVPHPRTRSAVPRMAPVLDLSSMPVASPSRRLPQSNVLDLRPS